MFSKIEEIEIDGKTFWEPSVMLDDGPAIWQCGKIHSDRREAENQLKVMKATKGKHHKGSLYHH